jgi:hypothetical protein
MPFIWPGSTKRIEADRVSASAKSAFPQGNMVAQHLGLRELFDEHVNLGDAPGRANVGHEATTLVQSALAGGGCIEARHPPTS